MSNRKEILKKLISFDGSIDLLIENLSQYDWDIDEPLIKLTREDIATAIQKFLKKEISKNELNGWADVIEMRDDIEYEQGYEKLIATVLSELSSPEINNPLKREYLVDVLANLLLRK